MGFIEKAIDEVMAEIPEELLLLAFSGRLTPYSPHIQMSIPTMIRDQIIYRRFQKDLDLVGGSQELIPLRTVPMETIDDFNFVWRIPRELTGGRTITSPIHVSFGSVGGYGYNYGQAGYNYANQAQQGRGPISDMVQNVQATHAPIPEVTTSDVHLLCENTIVVKGIIPKTGDCWLLAYMGTDSQLSQITPPYYNRMAEFVVWATKAFIYRKLNIALDQGALVAGQQLGRIRDMVDEYSDANQTYRDMRKELLYKLARLNDRQWKARHVKTVAGGVN